MIMDDIHIKVKKWIELVQLEQLRGIAEDMKVTITSKPDARLSKVIFKLLLYLSHTADRCDKSDCQIGKEIWNLTRTICFTLVEVPDRNKFFSSIFHITRCLLMMHLYIEAIEICNYLLPGKYLNGISSDCFDIYVKLADLWHITISQLLKTLPNNINEEKYQTLIMIIKYELHILQLADKQYTKRTLSLVHFYLEKVTALVAQLEPRHKEKFHNIIITYLTHLDVSFTNDNNFSNYRYVLVIINKLVIDKITVTHIHFAVNELIKVCCLFEHSINEESECSQCFQLYKEVCTILLRPVDTFTEDIPKNIHRYTKQLEKVVDKFGFYNAVKWNVYSVAQILEPLFTYWEYCVKNGYTFLTADILREMINLVQYLGSILSIQKVESCKTCRVKECNMKSDIYNSAVLKLRCLGVISRISTKDLLRVIYPYARKLLEEIISSVGEMKESECKQWIQVWSTCGINIYNLGVNCQKDFYEESTFLFSLLLSCVARFEGVQTTSSHLNINNPVPCALHRLSSIHYSHEKYREAMTASAFDGLLSYKNSDSKAFRTWANIKYKCSTSESIMTMSMLKCIRTDEKIMNEIGLYVDLKDYDLVALCLREIKGLQEARFNSSVAIKAVLNELELLKPNALQYGQAVQLYGYHLLNFQCDYSLSEYLEKAISKLKQDKNNSLSCLCLRANLDFYRFWNHLYVISRKTQIEMDSAKFALHAPRLTIGQPQDSDNVVPAYTMINVREDNQLLFYLEKALNKWSICVESNIFEIVKGWQPMLTLHTIMIAGEYCRLHQFRACEVQAWTLAYRLAYELQDNRTKIYATGRCISLRHINDEWIDTTNELIINLRNSSDPEMVDTIAMFRLSLSDFYFEIGKYEEATKLFEEVVNLPEISPLQHLPTYLLSADTMLHNYKLNSHNIQDRQYAIHIVQCLYSMLTLNEMLRNPKWGYKEKQLYGYNVLFTSTNHLSLRMNSLLSFKEISAHLVQRLKLAQKLGATLRVAECLKFLCFIDLSRMQLDDCEVKLQGMEHILGIETFELSRNTKLQTTLDMYPVTSPSRIIDPVRDVRRNDTSPVLRKKVFAMPEFILHTDCSCYKCGNISYQYLVFACTHIRAQLYALQNQSVAALQHFHGAFKMKQKLLEKESEISLNDVSENKKHLIKQYPWQSYYNMVERVLFLLDFSRFVKKSKFRYQEEGLNVALEAINICRTHKLESHPIYVSANELVFEYRFESIFNDIEFSKFTIPDTNSIDISRFTQESKDIDSTRCITPKHDFPIKKSLSVRRNKTPPLLKLTKVNMNFSDDEDRIPSPRPSISKHKVSRLGDKPVRRKILDEEYSESSCTTNKPTLSTIVPTSDELNTNMSNVAAISLKQVIDKAVLIVPNISTKLRQIGEGETLEEPASMEKIEELIKMVEEIKVNTPSQQIRKSRVRPKLQKIVATGSSKSCEQESEKINEVIDLFKELLLTSKSVDNKINLPGKDIVKSKLSISSDRTSKNNDQSIENKTDFASKIKPIKRTYGKRSVRTYLSAPNVSANVQITSNSVRQDEICESLKLEAKSLIDSVCNNIEKKDCLNIPSIIVETADIHQEPKVTNNGYNKKRNNGTKEKKLTKYELEKTNREAKTTNVQKENLQRESRSRTKLLMVDALSSSTSNVNKKEKILKSLGENSASRIPEGSTDMSNTFVIYSDNKSESPGQKECTKVLRKSKKPIIQTNNLMKKKS